MLRRPYIVTKETYKLFMPTTQLFYHFSNEDFNKVKDVKHNRSISMFFAKPDPVSIKNLIKNGFSTFYSPLSIYYIYTIDLKQQLDKISYFYIMSSPAETKLFKNNEYLKKDFKGRSDWLINHGKPKTYFEDYYELLDNIDLNWLTFKPYANLQIEECKKHKEQKGRYAAYIPHLIIGCNYGEEFDIVNKEKFKI